MGIDILNAGTFALSDPDASIAGLRTLGTGATEAASGATVAAHTAAGAGAHGILTASNWTSHAFGGTTGGTTAYIAYGGGQFAGVFNSTAVGQTSPDGITWTARTLPSVLNCRGMAYGSGVFVTVVVNTTTALSSSDGITWTSRTLPSSSVWDAVAYGAGTFVTVSGTSGTTAASSPDGITWTARTLPATDTWSCITFAGGQFVAGGSTSGNIATSPDGITWTQRTGISSFGGIVNQIAGSGSNYVALGNSTLAFTSVDGVTWTTGGALPSNNAWQSLTYGNGTYVAVGQVPVAAGLSYAGVSYDLGSSWTFRPMPASSTYSGVAFGGSVWVASCSKHFASSS